MVGWGVQNHHQHQQEQQGWRKGPWTPEEDKLLTEYVTLHGEGRWSSVAKCAGLNRSGKSCRLRWVNYLRPGLKRGQITAQEEGIIIELHALWGNKWSTIARYLPGRTDNEIKNYWRTHFKKKDKSLSKQDKIKRSQNRKQQQHQQQQSQQQQEEPKQEPEPQTQDNMRINHDQDIASFMYPSNIIATAVTTNATAAAAVLEDQYNMSHYTVAPCSSDQSMVEEEYLWGSLWNLDDNPHGGGSGSGCDDGRGGRVDPMQGNKVNKGDVQSINQGFPTCGSGDYSYSAFYTGGYIF